MVARLAELPTPWIPDADFAPGTTQQFAGSQPHRLAMRGQLLLERASDLANVRTGGRGIPGFSGVPLSIDESVLHVSHDTFIQDRVFAVIGGDGCMCLRLPEEIGADLVENGLCIRAGKNLLTWPVESSHHLEVNWRILLHAYWHITNYSPKRSRRLWSEWVIQH